ncbi:MAG TPA: DUF1080 domain-containing protein [Caulobacteraceae bacterium]|jgi:hypothetical protein|nr:DUF1080 domain-containing protein [Caulobacteraceae bacterium]
MHRRSIITLGLLAAGAAVFPQAASAAARGRRWTTIFDGRSLKGWTPVGTANWTLADGAVQADKGNGFLVSDATYGDVEIRAEIWTDEKANSGVFVRATNPAQIGTATGYEFNIFDTRPDPSYGTGGIVDVAKVTTPTKAAGKWNVLEITAVGPHLTFKVNGVTTADGQDAKHAHGRIALQYGTGVVKFRKVQVREL